MTANLTSAANHPEFRSVILTVDHVSGPRIDGHQAQKAVFSTENLTEAMLALFNYYGEEHLLASAATIEIFQKAAQLPCPAIVYRTPHNTQIVLEWNCFAFLSQVGGSTKAAVTLALDNAGLAQVQSDEASGDVVPLLLMAFDVETVAGATAEVKQQAAKPKSRVTGQKPPRSSRNK